ncbi:cell surface glycoprotein CD200 receptor 1-like isoform X2 [Loxodonta africana]|uniref:cell surface glycoprotein CD200 receptor 1-like isoform X2 n=1 Tax=Loxodonta africana TaxID=9785 RepID=UPI0030CAD757
MPCTRGTSDLGWLLILTVFFVAVFSSFNNSFVDGTQKTQSNSIPPQEVNTWRSVLVGTKAMLTCRPVPLETLIGITWKIIFRDNTSCTKAYREDKNATMETNCTDKRITWASRANQNFSLHIDPVAITHDGYYMCKMATSNGNFRHGYHLQVLVLPRDYHAFN